ncbi:L-serine dehydratase [Ewingella americana]
MTVPSAKTGVFNVISVFDMFKVGIGPSSSHTLGPMKAGKQFVDDLLEKGMMADVTRVAVDVYGSLSLTGKGHHTDIAIILGLAGNKPDTVDIDGIPHFIRDVEQRRRLPLGDTHHEVDFPQDTGMVFRNENLSKHENGMQIHAFAGDKLLYSKTYYSVGGGFIVDDEHFGQPVLDQVTVPYAFNSASEMLAKCKETGLSLSALMMKNELAQHSKQDIELYFENIWQTMKACIDRGLNTEGVLPGPLRVPRRAPALRRMLVSNDKLSNDPMNVIDWVNMFALAVNEENAAGGRVVTAPTNGACGIVPAVLAYYDQFIESVSPDIYLRYFLTSGAIGILYKMNASISGAEVGCQGEVGVACSMAAAGLAELLGGSPEQVCVAAEIGMEHNLGLTCDPVAGQVQVPCIERNAIASVKAINSARMALRRTSEPRVSLDKVIETMYETGKDMNAKYRETSRGGLAIKVQCD